MKTVVMVLCMAGAALAQQQRKQQEPPATDRSGLGKMKTQAPEVSVRSGTEISFDDNILDLNNKQITQLESGTRPEKFRIDRADDIVYSVWAEVRVKGRLLGEATSAGAKVQPYFYQSSSIANYEEYELFVRRDLGRHEAGVEYQLDRDAYLRELEIVVPGPNLWESARYLEHDVEGYYLHRIGIVGLRGSAGWRIKDFDSPFEFRDIEGYFAAVGPTVDLGKGVSAFLRYEYSDLASAASSLDPDTSYTQHEIEVGGSVELFKILELSLRYRIGLRDYTTNNDPAIDPSHRDREDLRHKLSFRARLKLSKTWSLHLEYVYRRVDSDRPHDNDLTTNEPGNSTRNIVSIGATFVF